MLSREERIEEYYHQGTRELAALLVDTEDDLRWLIHLVRTVADMDDFETLVSAQHVCRNILDDWSK